MHGVWAIPCVLIIRLLRPVLILRLGFIRNDRIGHFAIDASEQKVRLKVNMVNAKLDLFW